MEVEMYPQKVKGNFPGGSSMLSRTPLFMGRIQILGNSEKKL
jgi:hypothetical protein